MDDSKNFIKDFLIKKSLGSSAEELGKGDQLLMFNNSYQVMSPKGSKQVMLKDGKDSMISIPANRIQFLLKKNVIQKLYKSDGAAAKITPAGFAKKQAASMGEGKGKTAPLYTVHNGRMKVQMEPPKWVHVQSGKGFTHHTEETSHEHPEDMERVHKLHDNIVSKTHPDDHEKLKKLVNDYVEKRRALKNMHSVNRGMTQGKANAPESFTKNAHKLSDDAAQAKKKLLDAYKVSLKKKLTGGK